MANGEKVQTGFIGLGSQGGAMARRMVEGGYDLKLWARRPESLAPYRDTAATYSVSLQELAMACDHVGICVVDDDGVKEICAQLIPAMKAGSRIVIHSTVHPQTCVELELQARARGIDVIDAPVSGGGQGATAGTLTVMVGGEAKAVAAARPIFETFAGLIVHLGCVGTGQLAKLVNNSLMAAHVALGYEALAAGSALGIDRGAMVELVRASSGRSFGFDVASRLPSPSAFAHGAKLLAKDVRLLGEVLGNHSAFLPFQQVAGPFLQRANEPPSQE
jgi:3-hydroxyisobutyrate dehydrogenase-like beta-hydroxyacid dehydrogenase